MDCPELDVKNEHMVDCADVATNCFAAQACRYFFTAPGTVLMRYSTPSSVSIIKQSCFCGSCFD